MHWSLLNTTDTMEMYEKRSWSFTYNQTYSKCITKTVETYRSLWNCSIHNFYFIGAYTLPYIYRIVLSRHVDFDRPSYQRVCIFPPDQKWSNKLRVRCALFQQFFCQNIVFSILFSPYCPSYQLHPCLSWLTCFPFSKVVVASLSRVHATSIVFFLYPF